MSRNEIWGTDNLNQRIWMARQIDDREEWEGTSIKQHGIVIFADFKTALQFFLIDCPDTDKVSGVLDNLYHIAFPNQAPAITILDAIAKELGR